MNDLVRLLHSGKPVRVLVGSKDMSNASEMLKVIPKDVEPYLPAWIKNMEVEIVLDTDDTSRAMARDEMQDVDK